MRIVDTWQIAEHTVIAHSTEQVGERTQWSVTAKGRSMTALSDRSLHRADRWPHRVISDPTARQIGERTLGCFVCECIVPSQWNSIFDHSALTDMPCAVTDHSVWPPTCPVRSPIIQCSYRSGLWSPILDSYTACLMQYWLLVEPSLARIHP